jgi:hypothetical protein
VTVRQGSLTGGSSHLTSVARDVRLPQFGFHA